MMGRDNDLVDETYFESTDPMPRGGFDASLLSEPVSVLRVRKAIVLATSATVTEAMRAMQRGHTGCIVVTEDGSDQSPVTGIFTERDVLFRIVDRGRNPAQLPLSDVMTPNPETLWVRSAVAYALNKMSVGGFRHIPVVDDENRPAFVVSVRDVVEYLVEAFPREILNLPPEEEIRPQKAREGA
ncbi:MAG: cyclic nucleotide-binding/CBS domain-containing protein [Myxococcota bacterium]